MKNIYFKRKDTVLRSLQEEKKKQKAQKAINWDRIVYIILLCLFLFFVGRYAFMKIYYVKADGQILFKNVSIQNLDDCRILEFKFGEGRHVKEGDTLFYYLNDDDNQDSGNNMAVSMSDSRKTNWQEREIIDIEEDIATIKKEIRQLKKAKSKAEGELEGIRQEVMLDILPKSTYDQKVEDVHEIAEKIDLLESKIDSLQDKIRKIRSTSYDDGAANIAASGNGGGNENRILPFISPMEGMITKIFKENDEVALKSEVIMHIQKSENVFIKAFFEQTDLQYLKNRNTVEIEFPDGTKCKGRINRFYYSTYRLPEEFQKKYEPTTRSLSVDIVPFNDAEYDKWQKYYKLSVIIRKRRFTWGSN
jgi:multidrug resistance efflux pump